jgi:hypothetical protein
MEDLSENKSKHGNDFKSQVLKVLKNLDNPAGITSIQMMKKYAYSGKYKPQFYVPFLLDLDGLLVAIFTTTSLRADRICTTQWNCFGIKQNKNIVKCYLIVPDTLPPEEEKNLIKENNKIKNIQYYSKIDAIIKLGQLREYLGALKNG